MQTDTLITSEELDRRRSAAERKHSAERLYIAVVAIVFTIMAVVFLFFPRTTYSELEKRELATFPDLSAMKGEPAAMTAAISQWFSDSEPYRDDFMTLSMNIRNAMRLTIGSPEEAVTFRPSDTPASAGEDDGGASDSAPGEYTNSVTADENAKLANAGIIIVGSGPNVRALMAFGGSSKGGGGYVDAVNSYAEAFPGVKVYAMVIPTATEFYLPEKAAKCSNPQRPTLVSIHDRLSPSVRYVDAYTALAEHVDEDIYLRTDHHWSPLGGYYAARQLAHVAGVPFKSLDSYERHVVHGFVGTMYGYSKDISVKNAPEDFVYYTPKGIDYTTTYITLNTNKDYQVVSESKPYTGRFFHHFKDGSGGAYCTFMGGDQHIVKVATGTPGSRRLLIIKDSYGNTLPGYLFYSFNEVHVVDFRYFTRNMKQYVAENHITDIVLAFNIFNAYSKGSTAKVKRYLTQKGGAFASSDAEKKSSAPVAPADEREEKKQSVHAAAPVEPVAPEPQAVPESAPEVAE